MSSITHNYYLSGLMQKPKSPEVTLNFRVGLDQSQLSISGFIFTPSGKANTTKSSGRAKTPTKGSILIIYVAFSVAQGVIYVL